MKGVKTGGRAKGTPNKTTAAIREAVLHAFDELGGADYLVRLGQEDPKAFCSLLGRVLPREVNAEVHGLTLAELVGSSMELEGMQARTPQPS